MRLVWIKEVIDCKNTRSGKLQSNIWRLLNDVNPVCKTVALDLETLGVGKFSVRKGQSVEAERPDGEAAVYFRIAPRLTITWTLSPLLRVGQILKFMYRLRVKDWPTVYLGFLVKMLIYINHYLLFQLMYTRIYINHRICVVYVFDVLSMY